MDKTMDDQGLLDLGNDVYAEVSEYRGKTYVSIRKWFKADDEKWYRTKNGLHLRYDDMIDVLVNVDAKGLIDYVQRKAREVNPDEHS